MITFHWLFLSCLLCLTFSQFTDYQQNALKIHNELRANHPGAGNLILKEELNEMAVKCAEFYLDLGVMDGSCPHKKHPQKGNATENFFLHVKDGFDPNLVAEAASREWYKGIKDWDFKKNGLKKGAPRHHEFPQMVCRHTGWLGFGIASSPEKGTFAVALYLGIFKWLWNAAVMKMNIFPPVSNKVDPRTADEILGVPYIGEPYQNLAIEEHNEQRERHPGTPKMTLNQELCKMATKCAERYLRLGKYDGNCKYKMTKTKMVAGENMFWHFSGSVDPSRVVDSGIAEWYSGIRKWDFEAGTPKKGLRRPKQFLQLICKICDKLGVGVAQDPENGTYVVALYLERVSGYWNEDKLREVILPPADPDEGKNLEQIFVVQPESYQLSGLEQHNDFRARHQGLPRMIMKEGLNDMAQKCAQWFIDNAERGETDISKCPHIKPHPVKGSPGANVYWNPHINMFTEYYVDQGIDQWYREGKEGWDWNTGSNVEGFRRPDVYIRLIYKYSQWLGIGLAQIEEKGTCMVALYLDDVDWTNFQKDLIQPIPDDLVVDEVEQIVTEDLKSYQNVALTYHNYLRAKHPGTPKMAITAGLNLISAKCAEWYLSGTDREKGSCPFKTHPSKGPTGEALYFHTNESFYPDTLVDVAIREGYAYGLESWDFDNGMPKDKHWHPELFTQMMSKLATRLGVGVAKKEEVGSLLVMLYLERRHGWKPEQYIKNLAPHVDSQNTGQGLGYPVQDFQRKALDLHNELRAKHPGTPKMFLSEAFISVATRCAEYYLQQNNLNRSCPFKKTLNPASTAHGWGENYFWLPYGEIQDKVGIVEKAIKVWYEEGAQWDFEAGDVKTTQEGKMAFPGRFLQLVYCKQPWFGIGVAEDLERGIFVVAIYADDVSKKSWLWKADHWKALILPAEEEIVTHEDWMKTAKHYPFVGLNSHNLFRSRHVDTPEMEPEVELNQNAKECAEYYQKNDILDHSCPFKGDAGENVYKLGPFDMITEDGCVSEAIASWYKDGKSFDYSNSDGTQEDETRYFTQLVWKASTSFGIGVLIWRKNICVVVGLYKEAGNVEGAFGENVKQLKEEFVESHEPPPPQWSGGGGFTDMVPPDYADGADAINIETPEEDKLEAEMEAYLSQHAGEAPDDGDPDTDAIVPSEVGK